MMRVARLRLKRSAVRCEDVPAHSDWIVKRRLVDREICGTQVLKPGEKRVKLPKRPQSGIVTPLGSSQPHSPGELVGGSDMKSTVRPSTRCEPKVAATDH